MVRVQGQLQPATLEQALQRTLELLRGRTAVLTAPTLTNEAMAALANGLKPLLPQTQFGCLPRAHSPWLVQGKISNLPYAKRIVLLGFDPWTELPVLALWLRKAVQAGGSLVAIGQRNGLFRDTAAWLQVDDAKIAETAAQLLAALAGGDQAAKAPAEVRTAAQKLGQNGPAVVLLHPDLAHDQKLLFLAQQLAQHLGADAATGMFGAPALGANARGAQEVAPDVANAVVEGTGLTGILLLGAEQLIPPCGAKLAVASARAVEERSDIEVVLPMLHAYESNGTYTNFSGQQQSLQAGGMVGRGIPSDQQLIAQLRAALTQAKSGVRA
jgi:NADH dehydrogenase/NADH:ubiquinone oxidoreductase subunit G